MRILFIFPFLTILSFASFGQIAEWKAEEYAKSFKLGTFLIYSFRCGDEVLPIPDTCKSETHYLIWKANNDYFIKRFETCGNYKTIQLNSINPLRFYLFYKPIIDKEEIKEPSFYEVRKVGNRKETLVSVISVSHSCYYKYELETNKDKKQKTVNKYYLDFLATKNGKKNISYRYNANSQLKALVVQSEELVKKFKTDRKFERE